MFDRRMKFLLLMLFSALSFFAIRIIYIQTTQCSHWRKIAEAKPRIPFRPIPANRGRILAQDRNSSTGKVALVENEPCFELAVFYPVMSPDKWWQRKQMRRIKRKMRQERGDTQKKISQAEILFSFQQQRAKFWEDLSRFTDIELSELLDRRDRIVEMIHRRVSHIRSKLSDVDYPLVEQRMYHTIVPGLSENESLSLRDKLSRSQWAIVRPSVKRVYRYPSLLSHIIGRTVLFPGSVPKSFDIIDEESLPGELQGLTGLEKRYDSLLRGHRGWVELSDEPRIRIKPEDGSDITLTIDVPLQEFVQKLLSKQVENLPYATGAAAVVMDLDGNNLLSVVSVPGYNLSDFSENYAALSEDGLNLPLFDRALMGKYPPGSIVKPAVGAWGITCGKISENTTFICRGYLSENTKRFRCWRPPPGHGELSLVDAIHQSCDVYFYHLGELISAQSLTHLYQSIGFGRSVHFDLPNTRGFVPTQKWFISRHGRGMSIGDARNLAIGQGDLLISPLQSVLMVSSLLTNKYQAPRLVVGSSVPKPVVVGFSQHAINLAKRGMEQTVNNPRGTAYKYVYTPKIHLAGKTGSAQSPPRRLWKVKYYDKKTQKHLTKVAQNLRFFLKRHHLERSEVEAHRFSYPVLSKEDQRDAYGRRRGLSHAWFVGYAPANNPKVVASVMVEYGISGGSAAGVVFKDIMLKCSELGYLD